MNYILVNTLNNIKHITAYKLFNIRYADKFYITMSLIKNS